MMLRCSRMAAARPAVAFFNIKHFQTKHKYRLTPQNAFETMAAVLNPSDRLLRHSVSGRGGARVLILDRHQKVKGIYYPLFCWPHPSAISDDSTTLGVTVEAYLKAIKRDDGMDREKEKVAHRIPTTLLLVSHPQGIGYGTFRADGTPGVPLQNFPLDAIVDAVELDPHAEEKGMSITPLNSAAFGTRLSLMRTTDGAQSYAKQVISLLNDSRYGAEIRSCSTFWWISRESSASFSLNLAKNAEVSLAEETAASADGGSSSSLSSSPSAPAVAFTDKRWVTALDNVLVPDRGLHIYGRDPLSGRRIVDVEGLRSSVCKGEIWLDSVPVTRSMPTDASSSHCNLGN